MPFYTKEICDKIGNKKSFSARIKIEGQPNKRVVKAQVLYGWAGGYEYGTQAP